MARPKLSTDNRRSINFTVRLTGDELNRLVRLADQYGKAPGTLMRYKFFNSKFPEPKMAKLDLDTYLELKRIGVNLNQLARKANAGVLPTGMLGIITKLLKQQETLIKLLLHDRQPENR